MTFAARLKLLRGGQSQKAAALACGIKQQVWNRYEKGENLPGAESIISICRVFNVSADELLGIAATPTAPIVATNGSAVAVGSGARASIKAAAPKTDCVKCPYQLAVKKLQKAGLKIPGLS